MRKEEEIGFVARHYRRGKFDTRTAWLRMGLGSRHRWSGWRIAASIAITVALGATAAMLIRSEFRIHEQEPTEVPVAPSAAPTAAVKSLDFEGASLPTVLNEIHEAYGVEVTGAPANAGELKLTLHYEGNVVDLISTINEILGTSLELKE